MESYKGLKHVFLGGDYVLNPFNTLLDEPQASMKDVNAFVANVNVGDSTFVICPNGYLEYKGAQSHK